MIIFIFFRSFNTLFCDIEHQVVHGGADLNVFQGFLRKLVKYAPNTSNTGVEECHPVRSHCLTRLFSGTVCWYLLKIYSTIALVTEHKQGFCCGIGRGRSAKLVFWSQLYHANLFFWSLVHRNFIWIKREKRFSCILSQSKVGAQSAEKQRKSLAKPEC